MSNVGTVGSRRTDELLQEVAHDAGIAAEGRQVRITAGTKSQAQIWKERHGDAAPVDVLKAVVKGVGEHALPDAAEHLLHVEGVAVGGLVVGGIFKLYAECLHELDRAERKAEELRNAGDNDAVNVALAAGLAFDPRFADAERAKRPGVEKAAGQVLEALSGKDATIRQILQLRADEGFVAARRAFDATTGMKPETRAAAMQRLVGPRMREDAAFGKGVEYFMWAAGTRGVDLAGEVRKVEDRRPPSAGVHVRG